MDKKTIALGLMLGICAASAQTSIEATGDMGKISKPSAASAMITINSQQLADRSMVFIAALTSRSQLSAAYMEQALHITFRNGPNGDLYMSHDLGDGWVYGVERFGAKGKLKTGFRIGFYNTNRSADSSSIRLIGFEDFRRRLTDHGYVESDIRGEIGEVVSWRFSKEDLVIVITPADLVTGSDGARFVRVIETHDA